MIAGVFTVPGDGCVDYPAVFRELPGYAGWVVVEAEQDPAKAHPLTYAKLGYRNLRGYLGRGLLQELPGWSEETRDRSRCTQRHFDLSPDLAQHVRLQEALDEQHEQRSTAPAGSAR